MPSIAHALDAFTEILDYSASPEEAVAKLRAVKAAYDARTTAFNNITAKYSTRLTEEQNKHLEKVTMGIAKMIALNMAIIVDLKDMVEDRPDDILECLAKQTSTVADIFQDAYQYPENLMLDLLKDVSEMVDISRNALLTGVAPEQSKPDEATCH